VTFSFIPAIAIILLPVILRHLRIFAASLSITPF
jgi:hypothetical protein